MSDPFGSPLVQACLTFGSISIDLIDVIGNAIDLAHGVVHRRPRVIGLDRRRIGGLLRLCSRSLSVCCIFLRA
jgi:hypothetical protein